MSLAHKAQKRLYARPLPDAAHLAIGELCTNTF